MRGRLFRHITLALALLVVWLVVLAWAAGMPAYSPLSPRQRVAFDGIDFRPALGAGVEDGRALGVGAISEDGNALQTTPLNHLRAADFPILRYRLDGFPRTLELSLVFRRADTPDDIAVSLPWPGKGTTSVDLSVLPEWRGEITELAFAEFAAAQIAPPSTAFKPFRLVKAQLESRSWRSVPSLLRTAWFGYRPWALLSVSALGPAIESVGTSSVQPAIAWGAVFSLIVAALILNWSREKTVRVALAVAMTLWVLLDVRWFDDLAAKHRLTEQIYSGKPWAQRENLQPDEETPAMAKIVKSQIGSVPPPRVLVASDSIFPLLRMIYFLLPLNAAPLEHGAMQSTPALPRGSVIVAYASSWQFNAAAGVLVNGDRKIPVEPVFSTQELAIYRVGGAQP